jgi:hypothetical protein
MNASKNAQRCLPGLIILLLVIWTASASGQQAQVSAFIDANNVPQPGTITVPAGSTAAGFQMIFLHTGIPASGPLDHDSFYIYLLGTTTVAYSYYKQNNQPPVQAPAPVTLATLVLGPGQYSVYVSGGPASSLLLAYNLGSGGSVAGGGPMSSDKSNMSSRYEPNCVGDVFQGGRWNGSENGSAWLELDFASPRSVSEIRIKMAGTDVTTKGARIVLKLQTPDGQWVTVDDLQNTNINIFTPLTGGATGNSIPSYRKILTTPMTAQAFRIEFTGNGWFVAEDIQVVF